MYSQSRIYDLSFVSSSKGKKPRLVFTIQLKHLEKCLSRLERLTTRIDPKVYCERDVDFFFPPNLLNKTDFGYGACGSMFELEDEVSFSIELSGPHLKNAALTVHVLATALSPSLEESPQPSNHIQQVTLETCCKHDAYGHATAGYLAAHVCEWLRKQWQKGTADTRSSQVAMPRKVVAAMKDVWKAVAPLGQKKWAKDCGGSIYEDGRFLLGCFGNACDLSIYPDSMYIDESYPSRFSCHNLDTATQQLTLLAGLAKLCELARAET